MDVNDAGMELKTAGDALGADGGEGGGGGRRGRASPAARGANGGVARKPPRLKFELRRRGWNVAGYAIVLLFFNLGVPAALYYLLNDNTAISQRALYGIASGALGISSCFDAPNRLWKLWRYRDTLGPLGDDRRYSLDFTMRLYTLALLTMAIPLAIGPSTNPPIIRLFYMTFAFFTTPIGVVMIVSLFSPRFPWWHSSDPPYTPMKPAAFYMCEDLLAVDFRHGRELRKAMHARYNASPPYRRMMRLLTVFWACGCFVYTGIDFLVTYCASTEVAFALVLGMFFAVLAVWIVASVGLLHWGLGEEAKWWAEKDETIEAS